VTGFMAALLRQQQIREAVASVSLSHPKSCGCRTCRAAQGDEDAFAQLYVEVSEAFDERDARP
jgi:hypothetical protein